MKQRGVQEDKLLPIPLVKYVEKYKVLRKMTALGIVLGPILGTFPMSFANPVLLSGFAFIRNLALLFYGQGIESITSDIDFGKKYLQLCRKTIYKNPDYLKLWDETVSKAQDAGKNFVARIQK